MGPAARSSPACAMQAPTLPPPWPFSSICPLLPNLEQGSRAFFSVTRKLAIRQDNSSLCLRGPVMAPGLP